MTLKEFCKITGFTEAQATGKEEIKGNAYLSSLTSIPDGATLNIGGNADLRSLTSIPDGATLNIGGNAYLSSLTSIPDGATLNIGGYADLSSLTSIPDGATLNIGGNADLRSLTSIPDGATLNIGGYADLRSLTSIPDGATLNIGGNADLRSGRIYRGNKVPDEVLQLRYVWRNNEFIKVDGIFTRIISERGNVMRVQRIAHKEIEYLVTDGEGRWSHGATLREARESLIYKITSRDTTKYESWTLETEITHAEAIEAYRTITGACAFGTRHFCETILGDKKKDKYTVAEVIELTKGQYGAERFKEFFKK